MLRKLLKNAERGQAIVIIAFAMVGLIGMVGLMTDGGILLIEYGKLKRGIDSASIAAASQFRKNFEGEDLVNAAREFLILNQSDASNITVFRCRRDPNTGVLETDVDGTVHDEEICTTPRRKLLRVYAERTVEFGFMRVLGITSTTIRAASVGEAASIDLVLVIDTSASMSYETGGNPNFPDSALDDPSVCNTSVSNPCEPMDSVKNVAEEFVTGDFLFFPYDRVSIVAMTSQTPGGTRDHVTVLPLSDSEGDVVDAIESLNVFEPPVCVLGQTPDVAPPNGTPGAPSAGPCLNYVSGNFVGLECPIWRYGPDLVPGTIDDTVYDVSSCNSSNVGGALVRAASEFAVDPVREDSFWAVIALVGGPANATDSFDGFEFGYCPPNTWNDTGDRDGDGDNTDPGSAAPADRNPFCRDAYASTRHSDGDADYDADDYARDMADYLADPVDGQGVTVYTIGLGNLLQNASKGDPDAGEQLLIYVAETAGGVNANHGFYSFTPDADGLEAIFLEIASNIFTRLSQ
ncbi:MAG TPA: VWA domain-containing protein [Anaerolineales bacterium]|jgi:hypothetical protein|nr:hypothetical protein [Anaerolineae bacterium]HRJ55952.1 VWA domain-containing protein [Anaerolineales bacterium]HRK88564.1 VWA domain-containing protein [Anaerolineales bacterium]